MAMDNDNIRRKKRKLQNKHKALFSLVAHIANERHDLFKDNNKDNNKEIKNG